MCSSDLEVLNRVTNYEKLEKACVIFICVGNVPKYLWNTVSYYQFANTKNIGEVQTEPADYDLQDLIIIRLGAWLAKDNTDIIKFLHGIFFNEPKELEAYIDFSKNETFRKEVEELGLTGEHLIERARLEFEETEKKYLKELWENKKELQENKKELQEKDEKLQEKDEKLQEKDEKLQEKEEEIAKLRAQLAELEKGKQ